MGPVFAVGVEPDKRRNGRSMVPVLQPSKPASKPLVKFATLAPGGGDEPPELGCDVGTGAATGAGLGAGTGTGVGNGVGAELGTGTGNSDGRTVGLPEGEGVTGGLVDAFPADTQSPTRMSSSAKSPVWSRTPPGIVYLFRRDERGRQNDGVRWASATYP